MQLIDVVGRTVFADLAGGEGTPEDESPVWPIALALCQRIPHPLVLPDRDREEFVEAVSRWDRRVDTDGFLIEAMEFAWLAQFGEPPRSPARARLPGPWRPLHYPEALDPVDPVLWNLLRVAFGVLEGRVTDPPSLLTAEELRSAWDRARDTLDGVLATACARQAARLLGVGWAAQESGWRWSTGAAWRLLLLEGLLREMVGAVRAMVLETEAWLEEYDALPNQFATWARYGLEQLDF